MSNMKLKSEKYFCTAVCKFDEADENRINGFIVVREIWHRAGIFSLVKKKLWQFVKKYQNKKRFVLNHLSEKQFVLTV